MILHWLMWPFYCAKNAFQGSNKVIHMFIRTDSQGVKIARLADDEVFVRRLDQRSSQSWHRAVLDQCMELRVLVLSWLYQGTRESPAEGVIFQFAFIKIFILVYRTLNLSILTRWYNRNLTIVHLIRFNPRNLILPLSKFWKNISNWRLKMLNNYFHWPGFCLNSYFAQDFYFGVLLVIWFEGLENL